MWNIKSRDGIRGFAVIYIGDKEGVSFYHYASGDAMTCPDCGKEMVKRKGKRGEFLGCTGFPDCRHTAPITSTGPVEDSDRKSALKAYNNFLAKKGWTEAQGTKWTMETMGLNYDQSRINTFDKKQCTLLTEYIKLEMTEGGESEIALAFRKAKEKKR